MRPGEAHGAAAGAVAAGGAPGGAAVRLDQGTYSDEIRERTLTKTLRGFRGYRARLIDYGGGLAEAGFAFIGEFPRSQSIVGEGNIDVEPPRHGSGNPRLALCRYLSKYLSKEFCGPGTLNRHRFRASRGIEVPLRLVRLGTRTMSGALEATRGLVKIAAGIVGYHYVHDEYGAGVVFSWDLNGR